MPPTYYQRYMQDLQQSKHHPSPTHTFQMAEEFVELPEFNPRERAKQQISVPFLWEVKPGAPKKDWVVSKPEPPVFTSCPSPLKLVVSVPFQWEEKPGKLLHDASPLHAPPGHHHAASPCSLNPFLAEGEEEYTLGFDLEAFGFPDDNKASGIAEYTDGSSRHGAWYSFSESEDYSNSSGNTSARESQFLPRAPSERSWEVAADDDDHHHQQTKPWSPPRSAFTLEELMMLSRKLGCGQGFSADVKKKSLSSSSSSSLSSVELIKRFLIVCS